MNTIGKRIEFYRKRKGLKQAELAKILNLKSDSTVSSWEQNLSSPKANMLLDLCDILEISISELFGVENKERNISPKLLELLKQAEKFEESEQEELLKFADYLEYKNNKKNLKWGRAEEVRGI